MTAPGPPARPSSLLRAQTLQALGHRPGTALSLGGVPVETLAERFGTPLYAYDAQVVRDRWSLLRTHLGPRVEILHSVKSNPNLALAQLLRQQGAGAEVASAGEVHLARAAGHPGARIQFAGPGKSREDLETALAAGVGVINLESEGEQELLADLCRARGGRQAVAIRVNPREGMAGARMLMGGASKKFGVDAERVVPLARRIERDESLDLVGLHGFAGTQCFDAQAWLNHASGLVDLLHEVEGALGRTLAGVNLGGGFGVACHEGDPTLDLDALGKGLEALIRRDGQEARRWFVEPGRALVAPAGVYLTRVLYRKASKGRQHAIVDGGMHHHSAAAGVGAILRRAFPLVLCRAPDGKAEETYAVGGPLCTPADELAAEVALPRLEVGDLLAVLVSGAYGLTFSNTGFLSHATPAEVLVDQGRVWLVREAGRPEDVLRGQRPAGDPAP